MNVSGYRVGESGVPIFRFVISELCDRMRYNSYYTAGDETDRNRLK